MVYYQLPMAEAIELLQKKIKEQGTQLKDKKQFEHLLKHGQYRVFGGIALKEGYMTFTDYEYEVLSV